MNTGVSNALGKAQEWALGRLAAVGSAWTWRLDSPRCADSTGPAPLAGSCMGLNHSGITGLTLMPTPSCRLGVQFHPACRAAVHFVAGVSGDGCGLASEVRPRPAGPALGRRLRISSITGRSNVASTILPCREAAGRERRLMAGTGGMSRRQ